MEHTAHGPPIRPSDKTNESDGRVMQCKSMMERKNKAKIGVGNMRRDLQRAGDVEIYAKEGEERDETTQDHDEALNAEDIETKNILPTLVLPSQADIDEHNIDHLPFRCWCAECVNGRGRERPHTRVPGRRKIPTLAFDYCFISKDGVHTRDEWKAMPEDAAGVKVLVAREITTKCTFAHVVKCKGLDDERFAVDCLVRDVEWLGFSRIMLRSDNERAIVALLKESLKAIRVEVDGIEQVAEEHPPEYDPQANGAVENAVGGFKGLMRTYHLALEARIGHRIPPDHPIVTWLVQHTTFLMDVRIKSDDGKRHTNVFG